MATNPKKMSAFSMFKSQLSNSGRKIDVDFREGARETSRQKTDKSPKSKAGRSRRVRRNDSRSQVGISI